MDVAVTGSHGFIGSALLPALTREGHRPVRIVRGRPAGDDELGWDPTAGTIDAAGLEGIGGVVHLAGAGIGDKRWTDARKRLILESRTKGTGLLARTLAGLTHPPAALVSASAIGYYGNRGDEPLDEQSAPCKDFVAGVCVQWEAATAPAADTGIRVARVRSGIVLGREGGVLPRMLFPFRLGLGGRIASGRQYMSWISIDDEVRAIVHALTQDGVAGPVNLTGPAPVTNDEFTKTLGRVVRRPTVIPTPLSPLQVRYGTELVQHLLVEGQRVLPKRLQATGYTFEHPTLEEALRAALDRHRRRHES
ncbi:MAG TPA: TIGR01777 family oxidoreductase [Acidimicrobiia bacterium]|nr:TIGR01777 family oxidoreductase [Acidimicrobiia bacterium]